MKVNNIAVGLSEFFASLLPNITKKQMLVDATHSYEELRQIVLPMYNLDIDGTFKGEVSKEMDDRLRKAKLMDGKNAYTTIGKGLKKIEEQSEDVIKLLETEFGSEIIKDVLDYRKLNIIYYLEALNFVNDYARRYILAVVHDEFDSDLANRITGPVDKATRQWVMDMRNMDSFITVFEILTNPLKSFLNKIKDLEGHVFEPNEWNAIRSNNETKLDPYGFGFIPVRWNPAFHIGMAYNGWRMRCYERDKEEFAKLQLMVLALNEQKSKTTNKETLASLEKQINYHSNNINKLQAKIEEMEE